MTTEASTQARPTRRRVRWFAGLTALLLAVIAWLVLTAPGWLQHQFVRQLAASLHREVTLERLELHPLSLSAVLHGLSVKNGLGGELAGLDQLDLDLSGTSWSQRALVIERLRLQGLRLRVTHLGQGRYDVSDLIDAWTQAPSGGGVPPFVLQQFDVSGRLVFDDRPKGRVHTLDDLHLTLPHLSSMPAEREAVVQPTLSATLDGAPLQLTAQTAPFADTPAGQVSLSLSHVDLAPLRAYLPPTLSVQPTHGRLDAQLQLTFALPTQGVPTLSLSGQGRVSDLRLDDARGQSLLTFQSLALQIAHADLMRRDVALSEVTLDGPALRLGIDREGRFHLGAGGSAVAPATATTTAVPAPRAAASPSTAATPSATPSSASATATTPPPWALRIARVRVRQGVLDFNDDSVQPGFHGRIDALAGEVRGLSTQADSMADLSLQGRYAQNAPVTIQARLNPLAVKKFLDLRAKVRNVESTRFSAYAGKYAGYLIEKGKFSLDASYRLEDGRLQAENHVFIDQLTFGAHVDSPSATSLPVRLAMALLKNVRGEIELDLPVRGSLDDPQFSVPGLLWKVLGNLVMKVVAAPFSFLSTVFGDGEELSTLRFAPGTATLDVGANKKLASLARAMQAHDALTLEVRGLYDAVRDTVSGALQTEPGARVPARATDSQVGNAAASAAAPMAVVSVRDLESLARRRAQVIVHALITQYQVPPERVFELAAQPRPDDMPVTVGAAFALR